MKNHAVEQPTVEQPPVTVAYLLGSLRMGGAEKHVTCLLEGLDKTRYRPLLFLTRKTGPYLPRIEKLGIPVRETGVRSVFTFSGFRGIHRLSKVMRQEDVRIVHSYLYGANLIGVALTWLDSRLYHLVALRRRLLPHGYFFRPLFRLVQGHRTRVVSVSQSADEVIASWGVRPRWRSVVPNGIDVFPARGPGERAAVRRLLGLPEDAAVITMVANFAPIKGHRDLIRALALLPDELTPAPRLCLVGEGKLVEECRELARSLEVSDRVHFLGRRQDVPDILLATDVAVLNSLSEGMSNALLEAAAAGLPSIATNVGGNPEVVEDGVTGFLVPPQDPPALAAQLERLLRDEPLRRRMSAAARERVHRIFSLEAMVRATEAIYQEVLREERPITSR